MRTLAMLALALAVAPGAVAQTFDAISIRETTSGPLDGSVFRFDPGRLVAVNQSLIQMIVYGFGVRAGLQGNLIIGMPDELMGRRFDVTATLLPGGEEVPMEQRRSMVRSLLQDRFGLLTHTETRRIPVYKLTLVREGSLGPALRRSAFDCDDFRRQVALGTASEEPTSDDGFFLCRGNIESGRSLVARSAGTIGRLIVQVQPFLDRLIADETGLDGTLEWRLAFTSAPVFRFRLDDPDVPEIFTAFREQLGLRLVPGEAEMDVVVIDAVSLPTPN